MKPRWDRALFGGVLLLTLGCPVWLTAAYLTVLREGPWDATVYALLLHGTLAAAAGVLVWYADGA